jgi:hypothetical protein
MFHIVGVNSSWPFIRLFLQFFFADAQYLLCPATDKSKRAQCGAIVEDSPCVHHFVQAAEDISRNSVFLPNSLL